MNYLSLDGAAEELAVSTKTIRRMISSGDLPAYRVRRQVRIRRADLEKTLVRIPAGAA
jgi:excisionase family DNA binding protein